MTHIVATRVSSLIAVLGSFTISFAQPAGAGGQAGLGLAIYTKFEKSPPPAPVIRSMEAEVESIVSPVGVALAWVPLKGQSEYPTATDLMVVTFRGECDPGRGIVPVRTPGPLGWAYMSGAEVIPFADVDCNRLRQLLWTDLDGTKPLARQSLLGRALGAVVAHELYHVLARTKNHSSACLGKAVLSNRDLMDERCRFQAQEIHRIRAALSRSGHTLAVAGGGSDGSGAAGDQIYEKSGCTTCQSGQAGANRGPALPPNRNPRALKVLP